MGKIKEFLKLHRPAVLLMVIVLVLTSIPVLDVFIVTGKVWQGFPPIFTDSFYDSRVQTVVKGNTIAGEPYFFEHRNDPPLVIFAGVWLNAIPQLAGLPLEASLLLNFIVWSLLFAAVAYRLFRELRMPRWIGVGGTGLLYLESYSHVWRTVNLQTVFPIYFLFYIALARFIRDQSRKNIVFLSLAIGATFYFFSYLWQAVGITLVLLLLYALVRKDWRFLKKAFISSVIGGLIGAPAPLYMLWLSFKSPYFWESMGRLGLVSTHIPTSEIFYSGGWIGLSLFLIAILFWRARTFRKDAEFVPFFVFTCISGLGLWIMQGSNLITGKWLETGEHVRILLLPWLIWSTIALAVFLWRRRAQLSRGIKAFSVIMLITLSGGNIYFFCYYFSPFLPANFDQQGFQTQELYAKPLTWFEQNVKDPSVIWSDPHEFLSTLVPIYTKNYTLYAYYGMLELMPEGEIRERYLVSQYFNNPTVADLENSDNMAPYLGRHDYRS